MPEPTSSGTALAGSPSRTERHPWRLGSRLRSPDGRAVCVLVVVPVLMFVVPALAGHPAIAGDNLIQNFPLRALSGRLVSQGHLPLWNTYIWSGSQLLGALNAGALYPLTLIFAVVPAVAAWVINLAAVYWVAGLGLYALLRQYRIRPLPALLGGLTYAYTGMMSSQIVHFGVVQGMAWIPVMVLAVLRLSWAVLGTGPTLDTNPPDTGTDVDAADTPTTGAGVDTGGGAPSSPWPWVVLLAVVLGLIGLTGEPRAMAEAEVVGLVLALWLLLRPYGGAVAWARRAAYLGYTALAIGWGILFAAVQLVPGWRFIGESQRSLEGYSFFATGSFHPQWSVLMLVPDLFGGDGVLHQPTYFNSYNLPEVTAYAGLVPLAAAAALLTLSFGRRRARRAADWGVWIALGGLGTLMAFGSYTWFGGLFGHIPLFDRVRLQSRNLGITDLALAVLLGFWLDRAMAGSPRRAGLEGWRRWVTVAPMLAAILLCGVAIAFPTTLQTAFTFQGIVDLGRKMTPWLVAQLAVAAALLVLLLGWRLLGAARRRWWLAGLVVVDIGLFVVSTSTGLTAGYATTQPSKAAASAVFSPQGRFAIYDTTALNLDDLSVVGQPDLNVLTTLPSVQGYGSIVSQSYGAVTGTHDLDTLDPCALATGVFVPLRLTSMITLPEFVAPQVSADGARLPQEGSPPPPPPPTCTAAPAPGGASSRTWWFGQALDVHDVRVGTTTSAGPPPDAASTRVGLLVAPGVVRWPSVSVAAAPDGTLAVALAHPEEAYGLVVASSTGRAAGFTDDTIVHASDDLYYSVAGVLQDALASARWRFTGTWREFARFAGPPVPPSVWVVGHPAGASVRVLSSNDSGNEVDLVHARGPVTIVRSVTYMRGWHVRVTATDGRARTIPILRVGLIQGVKLPAGTWTITFLYRPRGLISGVIGSLAGLLALVAAGVVWLVGRRRATAAEPTGAGAAHREAPGDR